MIRVAYDVSFAVPPEPGKPAIMTGVGRVIEELFKCLRVNPELDLKIVGGFAGDWNPMITSLSVKKLGLHGREAADAVTSRISNTVQAW